MERRHIRLLAIGSIVALAVAVIVIVLSSDRSHDLVLKVEPITASDEITVYAGGAVSSPGLYTLPRRSRVATLLDQAGVLDDADPSAIEMAAELHDGQQIIVPARTPVTARSPSALPATPTATSVGPINVNAATVDQLDQLPGIGPALAQRIVAYRAEHGPFASLDDLAGVQGISDRMVDDFRDRATVGP